LRYSVRRLIVENSRQYLGGHLSLFLLQFLEVNPSAHLSAPLTGESGRNRPHQVLILALSLFSRRVSQTRGYSRLFSENPVQC
jgi:hypothetical protein